MSSTEGTRLIAAVGWVDLSHILDLFVQDRKLEWLTLYTVNQLLLDRENRTTFWNRSKESQLLIQMLRKRETLDKKLKDSLHI
jgi:hypothetical protein